MILVRPIMVTPAMIVASNIEENDAVAWSTTDVYDEAQEVLFKQRVWESLVADNFNQQPDTGALADPPTWLDLGPANRYRMFDVSPSTTSQRAESIEHTIDPGRPIDVIGLVNLKAQEVTVERLSPEGEVLWAATRSLLDADALGNGEADYLTDIVFLGLPLTADWLRITISSPGATAKCGGCLIGRQAVLGDTLFGATIGIRDYSRKDTDEFGTTNITKRGYSKTADFSLVLDTSRLSAVQRQLAQVRAEPALFVGVSHRDVTIVYGFYKGFQLVISSPVRSTASIEVESLTYEGDDALFPAATVGTPTITSPASGDTVTEPPTLESSAFATTPDQVDSHASSDWQVSGDENFNGVVYESLNDTIAKVAITLPSGALEPEGFYYARVRHRGATLGLSQWSEPVSFFVEAQTGSVNQPSIVYPANDGDEHGIGVQIFSSEFAYTGAPDTHAASSWQIATDAGFSALVDETLNSSIHKTRYPPLAGALQEGQTYYARVQHIGTTFGASPWSAPRQFTAVDAFNGLGDSYQVDASDPSSSTSGANLKFFSDGTWRLLFSFFGATVFRYKNGQPVTSDDMGVWKGGIVNGADYEIRITVLSATGSYGGDVDDWRSLASNRNFAVAASSSFPTLSEANILVEIRPVARPAAVQTHEVSLKATAVSEV